MDKHQELKNKIIQIIRDNQAYGDVDVYQAVDQILSTVADAMPEKKASHIDSPQAIYTDTNPKVAYTLGKIDGNHILSEVQQILKGEE